MSQTRAAALVEQVGAELRERGERMTGPRRAVLLALASLPGHPSVEDIHAAADGGRLPRSSVYRALEALSALGVVQHIHLGHGATAYHLRDTDPAHVHAECRGCGAVLDLPANALDPVVEHLASLGFRLDAAHTSVSGRCADCR